MANFDEYVHDRNMVVYQGYQASFDPVTKAWGKTIPCSGHWPDPYPGCGAIRNGLGRRFRDRTQATTVLA